jgi:hypothetical protein
VIFDKPFRHAVINNFITAETIRAINEQWPSEWLIEDGKFNRKWSTQKLPPAAQAVADSINVGLIEEVTGISGLFADPDLFGAGLHCIPPRGFLKMHVDFNRHPKGWHRRANVLVYLNEDWREEWGGRLQLGLGDKAVRIVPEAGRCVIFETNEESWHGHPDKLACPLDRQRRSMALYYYTASAPTAEAHSTIYRRRAA